MRKVIVDEKLIVVEGREIRVVQWSDGSTKRYFTGFSPSISTADIRCPLGNGPCNNLGGPDPINFPEQLYCFVVKKWLDVLPTCPKEAL